MQRFAQRLFLGSTFLGACLWLGASADGQPGRPPMGPGAQPGGPGVAPKGPGVNPGGPGANPGGPGTLPARPNTPNVNQPSQPGTGATPAQPNPGTGTPATPATPNNPNAQGNTQTTPSRTPPPNNDDFRNNPVLGNNPAAGATNTNTGTTNPATGQNTNTSTGLANFNANNFVSGLTNLNLNTFTPQASNIVTINTSLNNSQIQSLMQTLNSNQQAATASQMLTQRLQQQGLIQQGQQVVGFNDGKLYVTAGNTGTNSGNDNGRGKSDEAHSRLNHGRLLTGLMDVNAANLNLKASDVVNVNTALSSSQMQGLMQSVSSNPNARRAAEDLTTRLRQQGLLQQNQRVVGFFDGKVYVTTSQ